MTELDHKCLFDVVGEAFIQRAIKEFYQRAVEDRIIGHFFFNSDLEQLIQKQIIFTAKLLGSKNHRYQGKPLTKAHKLLPLKNVHFARRQVLMGEVLYDLGLSEPLRNAWLGLEEDLRPLIVNSHSSCSS